jgi:hypothetical protein
VGQFLPQRKRLIHKNTCLHEVSTSCTISLYAAV